MTDSAPRLRKDLGLFDVFAVSTGAMFSSGFFLLPGLAFAQTGASVVLAYVIAGVLILPAMFSKAELSTALPRAGGTYYFLDRSLGPIAGTIGGLGTYLALTLKTAFALIGIGAYAAFFVELPIKPVAIALTIVFVIINAFGAKETTSLQRWLVITLLAVMALFVVQSIVHITQQAPDVTRERLSPFFSAGVTGLLSTVGFVFVSYAGLTKVASVAEEVRNPDRNLPLGMMLSLGVTSLVYAAGVFVIVAVVDPATLASDLTPVATAAETIFAWLPARIGLLLVVIAALAAFASTGNAGLLSASRYPFAMARDRLLPQPFSRLSRFHTPIPAILGTGALMIGFIVVLDAEGIAKLASAFQLFIFILVNFAVIVMRESRIDSYDPGYRSPLYPWMQLFGMLTSTVLIISMGAAAMLFTLGVIIVCFIWYRVYVASRVERHGAIYHWFSRLGRRRYTELDREFRGIMKEKGLRQQDPFDEIVARCAVLDVREATTFESIVDAAAAQFAERLELSDAEIAERFMQGTRTGETPVAQGVALPHFRTAAIDHAELVIVRCHPPVAVPADDPLTPEIEPDQLVRAVFFLISPEHDPAQHLRILAQIAGRVDESTFADDWTGARDEHELRTVLLRDDRFLTITLDPTGQASDWCDCPVRHIDLPPGALIAIIGRDDDRIIPSGDTVLRPGDRLTLIGQPDDIALVREFHAADAGPPRSIDPSPSGESHGDTPLADETQREMQQRLLFIAARCVGRDPDRARDAIAALRRMTDGGYGRCESCGEVISVEWLTLRPEATTCAECQPR